MIVDFHSFNAVGLAYIDVSIAWAMYTRAKAAGVGTEMAMQRSMIFEKPDLKDKMLWESYGVDSGEKALKEMLYPGEYVRLLDAVKDINGFQQRRKAWKEQAKN